MLKKKISVKVLQFCFLIFFDNFVDFYASHVSKAPDSKLQESCSPPHPPTVITFTDNYLLFETDKSKTTCDV